VYGILGKNNFLILSSASEESYQSSFSWKAAKQSLEALRGNIPSVSSHSEFARDVDVSSLSQVEKTEMSNQINEQTQHALLRSALLCSTLTRSAQGHGQQVVSDAALLCLPFLCCSLYSR
jgi:hypothetical protein